MGQTNRLVLFSGGGTAGHLAPGFALAQALEARGLATRFATPGTPPERSWFEGLTPPLRIPAARFPRGLLRGAAFPFRLARGVWCARRVLRRERVGCVVALGGWPCVPAVLAARMKRLPLAFLVADAVPGLVVRKLSRWARRVYVSHERAAVALGAAERVVLTPPLLRARIARGRRDPAAFAGLDRACRTLFVTGGSLGARGLNERVLAGLALAVEQDPGLRGRIQVLHSAGEEAAAIASRYSALDLRHHVTDYVHAMGTAYRSADLVICRAGANTCAELEATRTPAVLVPYPHHADRQQFLNAERLVAAGGCRLIEERALSPERVAGEVLALLADEAALEVMRAALGNAGANGAAETADDLIRFLGWDLEPAGAWRESRGPTSPPV